MLDGTVGGTQGCGTIADCSVAINARSAGGTYTARGCGTITGHGMCGWDREFGMSGMIGCCEGTTYPGGGP